MTLYKKIHLIQETLKVNFHAIYKHNKIFSKLKVSPQKNDTECSNENSSTH